MHSWELNKKFIGKQETEHNKIRPTKPQKTKKIRRTLGLKIRLKPTPDISALHNPSRNPPISIGKEKKHKKRKTLKTVQQNRKSEIDKTSRTEPLFGAKTPEET